ncbi:MAG: nucleotidyltransferase domain-containing protein [Candidatus Woesearchaeota archaeon]
MTKKSQSKKKNTNTKKADSSEKEKGMPMLKNDKGPKLPKEMQEKLDKAKLIVEKFQKKVMEKFDKYIMGIALLPPKKDKEGKVADDGKINLLVLVDDSDSQKMSKMELKEKLSAIITNIAKETDKKLEIESIILSELWQSCYDQKPELVQMIVGCVPFYDKGVLSAVKIGEVHKSMVIKKFEKYIVSYVIFGAFTKGRITPESDIDVAVIVDDTDVKKMTRAELKDKLRAIIISMGYDAKAITGVDREFHIQVYILTDFWDSIKEAHPVIFDLLRDGVPFYDRGIFMPWKQLLRMGKIKPSEEAIDMFMNSGDQMLKRVKFKLRDIAMEDVFLAILTPTQAALMTYGVPPPAPKECPGVLKEIFVDKENMLETKYVDIITEIIKTRKDIEHGKLKSISGNKIDDLLTKAESYLKRIQKLFKEIDERRNKEHITEIYERAITAVRDALVMEGIDSVKTDEITKMFKSKLIESGRLPEPMLKSLKAIFKAKKDFDSGKLTKNDVVKAKKASNGFIKSIVEYMQRKRGRELERSKIRIKHGNRFAEVLMLEDYAFIIPDLDAEEKEVQKAKIKKDGSLEAPVKSSFDEMEEALSKKTIFEKIFVKQKIFDSLEGLFGKNFEILINN